MSRRIAPYTLSRREVRPPKHVSVYTGGKRRWQDNVFTALLIAIGIMLVVAGASVAGFAFARHVASPAKKATVTKPPAHHAHLLTLALARPRLPANHARVVGSRATLCWSRVRGADGYELWVVGRTPLVLAKTCATLSFRPGRYVWRVAPLRNGPQRYRRRFSPARHFHVVAAIAAVHRTTQPVRPQTVASRPAVAPASTVAPRTSVRTGRQTVSAPVTRPVAQPTPVVHLIAPKPVKPAAPAEPAVSAPTVAPAPTQPPAKSTGCIPMYTC